MHIFSKVTLSSVLFLQVISLACISQPATEVYLFDISYEAYRPTLSNPRNISENPGYDNQPAFLPDGKGLLYASTKEGQTDIVRYDLTSGTKVWLTRTSGSEYSPMVMPDGKHFSAVRLEVDGTQLLYKYPLDPGREEILVPNLKIGYYCWVDANTLATFVLGEPPTLQIVRPNNGKLLSFKKEKNVVLKENIGRSIQKIPLTKEGISYIQVEPNGKRVIYAMDSRTGARSRLIEPLEDSQDLVWTSDGTIFMGQGSKLYRWTRGVNLDWEVIADLSVYNLSHISRLALHPSGKMLALVVAEEELAQNER
ncbi:MAG: hypothetical protein AAF694_12145 [Bacteroidota bacterium]